MTQAERIELDYEDGGSFSIEPPPMPGETASPSIKMHHMQKVLTPTIMMANKGGFIIMIPGQGVAAKSSLEDVMTFITEYIHTECYGGGRKGDLPRVVRDVARRAHDKGLTVVTRIGLFAAASLGVAYGMLA